MSHSALQATADSLTGRFGDSLSVTMSAVGELTAEINDAADLVDVATVIRDEFSFEILVDVAGVDYLGFGDEEWKTQAATDSGYNRAVDRHDASPEPDMQRRFAVVYHFLSISKNQRMRLRVFCPDSKQPRVSSLTEIWPVANWFEREAFDLFGILFDGHPDLRRLLTDYGFIGHPFRKDFPLIGNVEVRYDPEKGRVVYQPVSIEPRTLVPRVIRDDNRYSGELSDRLAKGEPDA
ncbi:MAG: NADH-quinone oxidoreductase subunit C [Gammaproteobacteria bacterium]|nr:NADH-quinone oxidoreductase subunit C [Gammaproteobacteria bacterium]